MTPRHGSYDDGTQNKILVVPWPFVTVGKNKTNTPRVPTLPTQASSAASSLLALVLVLVLAPNNMAASCSPQGGMQEHARRILPWRTCLSLPIQPDMRKQPRSPAPSTSLIYALHEQATTMT